MLVLLDMEWIENENGMFCPTQIAAIRVNSQWSVVDQYFSLIRPYDANYYQWHREAYNGATQGAFLTANGAHRVFSEIEAWLREDDEVCFWDQEAMWKYQKMLRIVLKQKTKTKLHFVCKRVKDMVDDDRNEEIDAYAMALERNITVPEPQHYAKNDVEAMRLLFAAIVKNQSDLLLPHKQKGEIIVRRNAETNENAPVFKLGLRPYWIDPKTNVLHAENCPKLLQANELRGYESFAVPLSKHARACSCVLKEYCKAAEKRNVDTLNRSQFNYVYASNSKVFHRYDCHTIRTMHTGMLMGAVYYDACTQSGRTPCRVCNPQPYLRDNYVPVQREYVPKKKKAPVILPVKKKKTKYEGVNRSLDMAEQKAYRRFVAAKHELNALYAFGHLSGEDRQDRMTLTHPGYAFFAGRGYDNFHLRHCPKLQGMKNVRGFSLYREAINAKLTPCKQCKPTEKHQITVSIPLSNSIRYNESPDMLDAMCEEADFDYEFEDPFYIITTSVGRWKINTNTCPVKVQHVNFVTSGKNADYHKQPRIFMSLTDTFNYILRHDRSLEKTHRKAFRNNTENDSI